VHNNEVPNMDKLKTNLIRLNNQLRPIMVAAAELDRFKSHTVMPPPSPLNVEHTER